MLSTNRTAFEKEALLSQSIMAKTPQAAKHHGMIFFLVKEDLKINNGDGR